MRTAETEELRAAWVAFAAASLTGINASIVDTPAEKAAAWAAQDANALLQEFKRRWWKVPDGD